MYRWFFELTYCIMHRVRVVRQYSRCCSMSLRVDETTYGVVIVVRVMGLETALAVLNLLRMPVLTLRRRLVISPLTARYSVAYAGGCSSIPSSRGSRVPALLLAVALLTSVASLLTTIALASLLLLLLLLVVVFPPQESLRSDWGLVVSELS